MLSSATNRRRDPVRWARSAVIVLSLLATAGVISAGEAAADVQYQFLVINENTDAVGTVYINGAAQEQAAASCNGTWYPLEGKGPWRVVVRGLPHTPNGGMYAAPAGTRVVGWFYSSSEHTCTSQAGVGPPPAGESPSGSKEFLVINANKDASATVTVNDVAQKQITPGGNGLWYALEGAPPWRVEVAGVPHACGTTVSSPEGTRVAGWCIVTDGDGFTGMSGFGPSPE